MLSWINKKRKRKGFTLVELVVVIAILGILAAIAVPRLGASRKRAAITAHNANVRTLMSAANMYIADKGVPTEVLTWSEGDKGGEKGWGAYLQEWPDPPNGTGESFDGEPYTVKIDTDGKITVTVGDVVIGEEGTTPGGNGGGGNGGDGNGGGGQD